MNDTGHCSICRNPTDVACSDCRINDGSIIYVCHKNVCQREHETAKKHVTNELFNRLDQVANNVCVFLLAHRNADAKAVILRELTDTHKCAHREAFRAALEIVKDIDWTSDKRDLEMEETRNKTLAEYVPEVIAALETAANKETISPALSSRDAATRLGITQ